MPRTDIAQIGKQATLDRLFDGSGFTNEHPLPAAGRGAGCSAHKLMLEGCDQPDALSVVLGLSKRFCYEDVAALWEGVLAAVREHGVKHLSLELNPSINGLAIGLAATGVQQRKVLDRRAVAKSRDLLCLSGHLGAAYMGLHVLEREKVAFTGTGEQPDLAPYKAVLASYLSPEIKPDMLARFLEAKVFPSRGYFLTRGLGEAVIRLTHDTGLGAKIYLENPEMLAWTLCVFILTDDRHAELNCLELGAADVIFKPWPEPDTLLARVKRTIELSREGEAIRASEHIVPSGGETPKEKSSNEG